jgi:hypothetical protein
MVNNTFCSMKVNGHGVERQGNSVGIPWKRAMRQPVLLWLLQLPLMSAAEFLPSSGKAQGRPLNQMVSPDRSTQALLFGMRKQSKFTGRFSQKLKVVN